MNQQSFLRENHLLTIQTDESMSTMVVSMHSDYLRDGLSFLLVILFGLPLCFAPRDLNDPSNFIIWGFIVILLLSLVSHSIYAKRSLKCVIKRDAGTIRYERGGFLDTPLFNETLDFTVLEIAGFEIKHYSRENWERFRILVVFKSGERLYLLDLGLPEYQTALEKIHNFIGPQLPIQVIDSDWIPW